MPAWDKNDAEGWAQLREFTIASLSDYYRDAYGWVKAIKPNAAVYLNAANVSEPAWIAGRDNHRLLPYADILAAEGGFHYGRVAGDPWKTSASSKFYETQAGGKPALNAVSSAEGGFRRCQLGAAEMRVLLADASRGVNPYAAFFYEGLGQGGDAATRDVFAWLAANESVLRGTRSAARVALLSSTYTLETYGGVDIPWADISGMKAEGGEGPGNHSRSFYGFYELLVRSRVPFDVLDDKAVEDGKLAGYDWLVLPTAACLSRAECEAIERFVRGGGKLIADFETSHYDERGKRQRQARLAAVFGCTSLNNVIGPRNWDFARTSGTAPYLAAISGPAVPATRHNLAVERTTGSVQMVFSERVISNIPDRVDFTDEPFLIENAVGAGRCFYFTGTFGELYLERRFPGYARLFRRLLETQDAPILRIENCPHLVEVNLRAAVDDGRRLFYLTNHELNGVEQIVPAVDLRVSLRDSKPVRGVRALRAGQALSFEQNGDELTFGLPRLEEFEVVLIEG
jgi:hypothetical protein